MGYFDLKKQIGSGGYKPSGGGYFELKNSLSPQLEALNRIEERRRREEEERQRRERMKAAKDVYKAKTEESIALAKKAEGYSVKGILGKAKDFFTEDSTASIYDTFYQKKVDREIQKAIEKNNQQAIVYARRAREATTPEEREKNLERYKTYIEANKQLAGRTGGELLNKTTGQLVGQSIGTALDLTPFLGFQSLGAKTAMKIGGKTATKLGAKVAGKKILNRIAKKSGKQLTKDILAEAGLFGGITGLAEGLKSKEDVKGLAKSTATGVGVGLAFAGSMIGIGKLSSKITREIFNKKGKAGLKKINEAIEKKEIKPKKVEEIVEKKGVGALDEEIKAAREYVKRKSTKLRKEDLAKSEKIASKIDNNTEKKMISFLEMVNLGKKTNPRIYREGMKIARDIGIKQKDKRKVADIFDSVLTTKRKQNKIKKEIKQREIETNRAMDKPKKSELAKNEVKLLKRREIDKLPDKDKNDYIKYLKPKEKKLRRPKESERIIIYSGDGKRGQYVDTIVENALNRGVDKNTKVKIVNKSELKLPSKDRAKRGERLYYPKSVVSKKIKEVAVKKHIKKIKGKKVKVREHLRKVYTKRKVKKIKKRTTVCRYCADEAKKHIDIAPIQKGVYVSGAKNKGEAERVAVGIYKANKDNKLKGNTHVWNQRGKDIYDFHLQKGKVKDSFRYVPEERIKELNKKEKVNIAKPRFRLAKNAPTLKTIERIKQDIKKPVVSKQALLAYINRGDIKQTERDLARKILNEFPEGKVNVQEFVDKVKTELLPLKPRIEEGKMPVEVFRLKDDFKEATGVTLTDKQEKEIMKLNKKIFGDEDVKITAQILANKDALGSYMDGMIKIVRGQANAKDTFYHEAVHKYFDIFLTEDEQINLLLKAKQEFGIKGNNFLKVEEELAERFIKYAKSREGMKGEIKNTFDRIISRIKRYFKNEESVQSLYADIFAGKRPSKRRVGVVRGVKPVGAGEAKLSRLEARIKNALDKAPEEVKDLASYNQMTKKENIRMALKYVNNNPEEAIKVLRGEIEPPKGILRNSIYVAIENLAQGDVELARKLASIHSTRMGQELSILSEINPDSSNRVISNIVKKRIEIFEKSTGKKFFQEKRKVVREIDKKIKSSMPTKEDWHSFINEITC